MFETENRLVDLHKKHMAYQLNLAPKLKPDSDLMTSNEEELLESWMGST